MAFNNQARNKDIWIIGFIIQGHKDVRKESLVNNNLVAAQQKTKLVVGIAAIFGFQLFSTDVTQGYFQSSEKS